MHPDDRSALVLREQRQAEFDDFTKRAAAVAMHPLAADRVEFANELAFASAILPDVGHLLLCAVNAGQGPADVNAWLARMQFADPRSLGMTHGH